MKTIFIPIFHRHINIAQTSDAQLEGIDTEFSRGAVFKRDNCLFLWINPKNTSSLETISHECVHLTTEVLSMAGVPISFDNDEIFAHLYSYILLEIKKYYDNL